MLSQLAEILRAQGLVSVEWAQVAVMRGELVRLYRRYYEGEHRLKLTDNMRRMMQIEQERMDRYNVNYCEMVVDTIGDRLNVETVAPTGGSDEARGWAQGILDGARFDGLQIDVHEAVLRDGVAYVMVEYDNEAGGVRFTLERAFDGVWGVVPVWDSSGREMVAAVKIWEEADGDTTRGNIYYPNSLQKYRFDGGGLTLIEEVATEGLGLPLVRFASKGGIRGRSELVNVIPLQDSLNRTLTSMVMSAELTAFSILFAKGFKPPTSITPGMIMHAAITDADGNALVPTNEEEARAYSAMINAYHLERIGGGSLAELIGQADWLIEQIGAVSNTPMAGEGGAGESGEALKMREAKLLGKVRRAHTIMGNAWEDVMALAHRATSLYGMARPPAVEGWQCRWLSAEVRADEEVRALAKLLHEWGYAREALRLVGQSSLVSYDEADIERLIAEKRRDDEASLLAVAGQLDGFGAFDLTP